MSQTFANLLLTWLCLGWPALLFGLGVLVGRHGFKHGLTLLLTKIFGHAPIDPEPGPEV